MRRSIALIVFVALVALVVYLVWSMTRPVRTMTTSFQAATSMLVISEGITTSIERTGDWPTGWADLYPSYAHGAPLPPAADDVQIDWKFTLERLRTYIDEQQLTPDDIALGGEGFAELRVIRYVGDGSPEQIETLERVWNQRLLSEVVTRFLE